ncbi:MAG TPA: hypothetical protein VHR47_01935 [Bacillota bacterium]|nr:hypothetical protein [Bacillota bacterium]
MIELTFVGSGKEPVRCKADSGLTIGDQIRQLIGGLTLAYGEQVYTQFINLDEEEQKDHPLAKEALEEGYQLPVLFLGNEPKYQGVIPIMAIKSLLDSLNIIPITYSK